MTLPVLLNGSKKEECTVNFHLTFYMIGYICKLIDGELYKRSKRPNEVVDSLAPCLEEVFLLPLSTLVLAYFHYPGRMSRL